ncbi:hypothetical protein LJB42_002128 [Komagataella kurtzmanii]|nr:hypothetical protein LJB42_002128 [Komagataella kurtzmanii]
MSETPTEASRSRFASRSNNTTPVQRNSMLFTNAGVPILQPDDDDFMKEKAEEDISSFDPPISSSNGIPNINTYNPGGVVSNLESPLKNFPPASLGSSRRSHRKNNSRISRTLSPTRSTDAYIPTPQLPPRSNSPLPSRSASPIRSTSPVRQPFSFEKHDSAPSKMNTKYRRGHKYKHSSISMNLFQEPPKRAPLAIPQQLPIPNRTELIESLTKEQNFSLLWCFFYFVYDVIVYGLSVHYGNICFSILSHLLFYDFFGNFIVVLVHVMSNFDSWNHSTLKYPFGLGRIEVLVGFALSVSLIFVGGDLISHILEELAVSLILHESHSERAKHSDHSESMNNWIYLGIVALSIAVAFASPRVINHYIQHDRKTFNNSTNFLSIAFGVYSLFYPLIKKSVHAELIIQGFIVLTSAIILWIGWKLIQSLSRIILISYPYTAKSYSQLIGTIRSHIHSIDGFKSTYAVNKIIISKVNYKIFVVLLSISIPGASEDDESKFTFYVSKIVRSCLNDAVTKNTHLKPQNLDSKAFLDQLLQQSSDIDIQTLDETGDRFEITVEVER